MNKNGKNLATSLVYSRTVIPPKRFGFTGFPKESVRQVKKLQRNYILIFLNLLYDKLCRQVPKNAFICRNENIKVWRLKDKMFDAALTKSKKFSYCLL